ncbi:MAG: hypothetical protein WAX04_01100 [Oscillospiraceae bacterium]
MKILSLNTNQFAGDKDIKDTAKMENLNLFSREIIALVKGFLIGNDKGIAILQEIPCYNFYGKKTRVLYDNFLKEFPKTRYKIITPSSLKANIITLAIVNAESGWHICEHGFASQVTNFKNRFIEAVNDNGIHLLGVHMPIDTKSKQDNVKFWQALFDYLKPKAQNNFFIVGDFNAHIGKCDYNEYFNNFLNNGYCDILPENKITYYKGKTKIDHILVFSEAPTVEASCLAEHYSDHAVIVTSEINITK